MTKEVLVLKTIRMCRICSAAPAAGWKTIRMCRIRGCGPSSKVSGNLGLGNVQNKNVGKSDG